jgi:hypothetical protein
VKRNVTPLFCKTIFYNMDVPSSAEGIFMFLIRLVEPNIMNLYYTCYNVLLYITTKFSTLKLLFFSFSSCLTIERSIVFNKRLWTSNVNRFRGFLVPRPHWIKVLFIRKTRTSSSITENSEIFKKFHKISNFS